MAERGGSGIVPALALSLALHLLLFWPAALPGPAPAAATLLSATLRGPAVVETAVAAVAVPAPVAETGARRAGPPVRPKPPRPAAVVTAVAVPPAPASHPVGQAEDAGAGGRVDPAAGATPAVAAAAATSTEALDADGLRAYRIALARGARVHKRYPPLARERGWTGTAEVRIDVAGEGGPRRIALAHSSGHDVLDRVAVDMMSRAAAGTRVPESLRGRAFAVSLPVVFELDGR
jgi:protein TonB